MGNEKIGQEGCYFFIDIGIDVDCMVGCEYQVVDWMGDFWLEYVGCVVDGQL